MPIVEIVVIRVVMSERTMTVCNEGWTEQLLVWGVLPTKLEY